MPRGVRVVRRVERLEPGEQRSRGAHGGHVARVEDRSVPPPTPARGHEADPGHRVDRGGDAHPELAARDAVQGRGSEAVVPPGERRRRDPQRRQHPLAEDEREVAAVGRGEDVGQPVGPAVAVGPRGPGPEQELAEAARFGEAGGVGGELLDRDQRQPAGRQVAPRRHAEARQQGSREAVEPHLTVPDGEPEHDRAERLGGREQLVGDGRVAPAADAVPAPDDQAGAAAGTAVSDRLVEPARVEADPGRRGGRPRLPGPDLPPPRRGGCRARRRGPSGGPRRPIAWRPCPPWDAPPAPAVAVASRSPAAFGPAVSGTGRQTKSLPGPTEPAVARTDRVNLFGSHSRPLAASLARVSEPDVWLTATRERLTVSSRNTPPLGAGPWGGDPLFHGEGGSRAGFAPLIVPEPSITVHAGLIARWGSDDGYGRPTARKRRAMPAWIRPAVRVPGGRQGAGSARPGTRAGSA